MRDHPVTGNLALGVPRGVSSVRPYDARWPHEFDLEAERLRPLLDPLEIRIEHVGSTAVPGLAAKPLLDIALSFADLDALEEGRRRLAADGYDDRGNRGAEGGVIMAKGPGSRRTHMLHLVVASDPQWTLWLAFRDALRRDEARRSAYEALKIDLAARFPLDRESYREGKRAFIEETIGSD